MNLDKLLSDLRQAEGFRRDPYPDGNGWSVGYGHWSASKPPSVEPELAGWMLERDVNDIIHRMNDCLVYPFVDDNDARQRCLIEMMFMLGWDGFIGFARMRDALLSRDYDQAAAEILDSKAARGDKSGRWLRLAMMMKTGRDATPSA